MYNPELERAAKNKPYLYITADKSRYGDMWEVIGYMVWLSPEDNKPRNYTTSSESTQDLQDLQITYSCHLYDYEPRRVLASYTAAYTSPYSVNMERAASMYSTLKKIKTGLEKLSNKAGPCRDFTSYVVRVMSVLGIAGIVFPMNRTTTYSDGEYTILEQTQDIAYKLDTLQRECKEKLCAHYQIDESILTEVCNF